MLCRGGKRLSRAVQRTRRRRPVGGHTQVGLATVGVLAEIAAGVLGTATTWVASAGSRAAGGKAQTPRLVGACERQVRVFFGGGGGAALLRASESPFPTIAAEACNPAVFTHMWYSAGRLPEVRGRAGAQAASASCASCRSNSTYKEASRSWSKQVRKCASNGTKWCTKNQMVLAPRHVKRSF
jgi:hypothetical protein